jgi:hypothetical protein
MALCEVGARLFTVRVRTGQPTTPAAALATAA